MHFSRARPKPDAPRDPALESLPKLPPATAARTLARIGRFLRPYRLQVAIALAALVVAAAATLAIGQGLKGVVDRGFAAGDAAELDRTLALMLGVIGVMAAATYTRFYFVSWLGERVTADLRRAVFDHLLTLPPSFYETTRTGEVISRLTNDTTMLETVIGSSASMAARNVLLLIGGLAMLALTSLKLTLLVLAGVPLVVLPIILFGRRVRKLSRASQDRVGEVGAYLDEALHEIRTVQAYGHEDVDRLRFGERVEAAFATARQRVRQRALLVAAVILLVFGAIGVILWIGGHDVVAGRLSGGALSAFVFYAVIVATSVGTLSEVFGDLQRAAGATERLFELLGTAPEIRAPSHPVALPTPPRGTVEFDSVTFHYPSRPDAPALDALSLAVAPGESVALVGPSGAGKTTLFALLLRFYDPQAGAIRIDGVDLRAARPGGGAPADRRGAAGSGDLRRQRAGERPLRPARGDRRRGPRRLRRRVRRRVRRRGCPRATRASSASGACGCRAASGSGWRSRGRSSPTGRSCCSTRPPRRSTPRASGWSSRRWRG